MNAPIYKRLLPYLRPHAWRMAITIVANLLAALLDGFAIALLIPFLNILFHQPSTSLKSGWVAKLLNATVGSQIIPGDEMRSLRNVILVVLASVLLKNLLVWIAGQFGATLQEYVTRDLRNQAYQHVLDLDMRFFNRTRAGQIITRLTSDADQLRLLLTKNLVKLATSVMQIVAAIAYMVAVSFKLVPRQRR